VTAHVAVIGTGYVGLTTGAYLAHLGHHVVCADVVADKVASLSKGEVPFFEAGLQEMVREGWAGGRLRFVLGAPAAVASREFIFLCLPTPQSENGAADLSYIESVATEIGPYLRPESVVITKSTVPVGTTTQVARLLARDDVHVVANPEFLREGSALHDCLHPDRIVIGSDNQEAAMRVASLFEHLEAPLIVTNPAAAEAIKYASNAFLATKVSFINAIAHLCEMFGADVRDVALGMGYDKRIGFEFLRPGPGFGGSCFAPNETILVRRHGAVRLMTFEDLFHQVDIAGASEWEALAWEPGVPTPEFRPITGFTSRPFAGDLVALKTKMGRRLRVTPDHPLLVADGSSDESQTVRADELTTTDWLPVAQNFPLILDDRPSLPGLLETLTAVGIGADKVIVRLSAVQQEQLFASASRPNSARRSEIRRTGTARLNELHAAGVTAEDGSYGTASNGTFVPARLDDDVELWRVVGLYLAEGHIGTDGRRERICWSFHKTDEADLVEDVRAYWERLGVKVTVRQLATTCQVSVSSRILAAWLEHGLGLGRNCYEQRIPDAIWLGGEWAKWQLLRGAWDGDGSCSLVAGGPSVVFEYGTASRQLADGILRLLGDVGVTARLKVGRTRKSTVDTYWVTVSGADQLEAAQWLFPEDEWRHTQISINHQAKRIRPTGYRQFSKNASWVRVVEVGRESYDGPVYSVEVEAAHTVVTTFGLVAHNCFPKDSRALIRMADEIGYDFEVLRAVVDQNQRQFAVVADKIQTAAGGSLADRTVAVWGLTFKARTDDLRESPALHVIDELRARGASVRAYDPMVKYEIDGIEICSDAYAACQGAAVLTVLTEWDDFRWLDFNKVGEVMTQRAVVDARNLLDPALLRHRGFIYDGIGRI
jgi:UDPglucose 6-dehydrogenase